MVATIGLAGCEKDCRNLPKKLSYLGVHLVGCVAGGVLAGMALGWLGDLLGAPSGGGVLLIVAAICAAYSLSALTILRLPRPSTDRQVPINWRRLPAPLMAFLYGVPLGAGILTRIFDGTVYALVVGIVLIGDSLVGAALLGTFGFSRGMFVMVVTGTGLREREDATRLVEGISALRRPARTAAGLCLGLTGGFLLVAATSGTI